METALEIRERLQGLSPDQLLDISEALENSHLSLWSPNPGPQAIAYSSLADETFTFYTQDVALESAGSSAGDGTPAPTAVNTGGELGANSNSSVALFAAAAGLFALAGGAMVLRRRTVDA